MTTRSRLRQSICTFATISCLAPGVLVSCDASGPVATENAESSAAGPVQQYTLRGKVVQLEPENRAATIEHEEIVGWMDAMTMRFPVKEPADWQKLAVGAEIEGTVFVSSDGFYIGEIEVIDDSAPQDPEQQEKP